jgi:hypothetical protein
MKTPHGGKQSSQREVLVTFRFFERVNQARNKQ